MHNHPQNLRLTPASQALARLRACCKTDCPQSDLWLAVIERAIADTYLGKPTNLGAQRTVFNRHTDFQRKLMKSAQVANRLQAQSYLKAKHYLPITDLLGIDRGYAHKVIREAMS